MGKITRLQLENFTCFEKLGLEFSEGVNVLMGVNGTGKTHILKVLYAACAITVGEDRGKYLSTELCSIFNPFVNGLGRLSRRPIEQGQETKIKIFRDNGVTLDLLFLPRSDDYYLTEHEEKGSPKWSEESLESVYIPVKEMLAHAPGFISLNHKREISFEEVYVNVITQAYLPKLRKLPNLEYEKIFRELGKAINGEVILKGEHFFLKNEQGELEFSLLAEGVRKLALIWLLIQNGSLNPGSILFWDEPEANLNPSLLGLVVETLLELQRQGVQIFLTTHNYVLLKEFDLRKKKDDSVRYISLFRENDSDPVSSHSTDEYLAINPNAIAGTFSDLYKRDISRALQVSQ